MIGARILRALWKRSVEQASAHKDVEKMLRSWTEDGVLHFGGTHALSGRYSGPELRAWLQRWFEAVSQLDFRVGRVALARPWAVGLTNTVMYEAAVEETRKSDGLHVRAEVLVVADVRRGKIAAERIYLFDETPELEMWGRRSRTPEAGG